MDRRATPPKRVTSPIWGTPPPCKQALIKYLDNDATKCDKEHKRYAHDLSALVSIQIKERKK